MATPRRETFPERFARHLREERTTRIGEANAPVASSVAMPWIRTIASEFDVPENTLTHTDVSSDPDFDYAAAGGEALEITPDGWWIHVMQRGLYLITAAPGFYGNAPVGSADGVYHHFQIDAWLHEDGEAPADEQDGHESTSGRWDGIRAIEEEWFMPPALLPGGLTHTTSIICPLEAEAWLRVMVESDCVGGSFNSVPNIGSPYGWYMNSQIRIALLTPISDDVFFPASGGLPTTIVP